MWSSRVLLAVQLVGFALGLGALAFYPPEQGKMILVPLTGSVAARIVPLALSAGAVLIATGPIRGSLVVSGERRRLSDALARTGTLMLASPPSLCGAALEKQA